MHHLRQQGRAAKPDPSFGASHAMAPLRTAERWKWFCTLPKEFFVVVDAVNAEGPSCPSVTATRQIEILELEDLEKECVLARIRLTLVQHDLSTAAVAGKRDAEQPPRSPPRCWSTLSELGRGRSNEF